MSITPLLTALAMSFAPEADIAAHTIFKAQTQPLAASGLSTRPGVQMTPDGNYMTTPENCTYRRTQAPGYPEMWILVLNPHHIGRPNSPTRCKGAL